MKSILVGLLFTIWIQSCPCYSQTDSVFCLPVGKARQVVSLALKGRLTDSLLHIADSRIALLEAEKLSSYASYTNLLNLSEQKYQKQKEITSDFVRLSEGWKKESEYFQKRSRKFRRQRNGLAVIALGILVLAAVK